MAKAKKNRKRSKKNEGDELLDDTTAVVAVAKKRPAKAQTKKQKASGRKTGPAASKAKAKKTSSQQTTFNHKTPKAGKTFERVYKGKTFTLKVKASAKAESGVVYVLGGKSYATPTDAADAALCVGKDRATGTNGWFFWGISKRPAR